MDPLVIAGSASQSLARAVTADLGAELGSVAIERFPDGEIQAEVDQEVRGKAVYVVQSTSPPVADNLLELLFIADGCRRTGAAGVAAVIPYFGYARQDRRVRPRESLGARVAADIVGVGRFERCLLVDLHSPPVEGFFSMPVVQLSALPLLARTVARDLNPDAVVVAPDIGAAKRAETFAATLRLPVALVHKTRLSGTEVVTTGVVGDVRKHEAVIVDDMISTGATVEAAVAALRVAGFLGTFTVVATHAVLTAEAPARLERLGLRRLLTTDTVRSGASPGGEIVSVAPLIATTIRELEARKEADMEPEQTGRKQLKKHVSLNESSEQELAAVDVIGPQHAHDIVDYRDQHGPFQSLDDLKRVPGVEPDLVSRLHELISAEGWHA